MISDHYIYKLGAPNWRYAFFFNSILHRLVRQRQIPIHPLQTAILGLQILQISSSCSCFWEHGVKWPTQDGKAVDLVAELAI